jgi:dipeptidyl aminopeptidase/acylaminoacyl peptidase
MSHGTSATITMVADRYAEVLHDAGFAVLLYDHRNFGISDGEPRGEISLWIQARGYRDAIDFVSSLPEIGPSRVAIWGDSFSAGLVLVVGTCDDRVKAIVSQTTACGPTMPPPESGRGVVCRGQKHLQRRRCEQTRPRDWSASGCLI